MRNFYSLLLMLIFAFSMQAQTTTIWLGGSTVWDDPANWSDGIPATGFIVTIPATPPNGSNFPIFTGGPLLDFTIQSFGGSITFNTVVYNTGSIVNSGGGSMINNSIFINAGMVTFNNNDGTFVNNGTVDNYGTFNNAGTSIIENPVGSVFNNYGNIDNFGTITNEGDILNFGNIVSTSTIQNNGNISNSGYMDIAFGGSFVNAIGAVVTNNAGAFVEINTGFINDGSIVNDGSWFIQVGSTFDNTGNFTSNGRFDLSGLFNNTGTTVNSDEMFINDSGKFDNNNIFTNTGTITLSVCGQIIQNANNNIGETILNDGIIYILNGSVTVTSNLEFGSEFTDLSQRKSPDTKCRSGMFVFLDENGQGSIDINAVDKNSYGFCGATIVDRVLSQSSFTVADLGVNELTLTTTDNFGFSSSCTSFITVVDYFPPVVPVDDPDIDFTCPADITVTTQPGASSEVASWVEPTATTTCTTGGGGGNGLPSCSSINESIAGFTYIGEYNESKYFVSTSSNYSWFDANTLATNNGGHIVTISDAAENEYVRSNLPSGSSTWLNFSDAASEGNWVWLTGETDTYTQWQSGEPNEGSNANYARLKEVNGNWTDRNGMSTQYNVVLEIPCNNSSSCEDVELQITFDNYPEDISWVINDSNGTTVASGGNYENEPNGSTVNITNCLSDGCYDFILTDSYGDGLCCSYGNGSWSLTNVDGTEYGSGAQFTTTQTASFCITIGGGNPGGNGLTVSQITGGTSGNLFPIGVSSVAYSVTDNCGNEEICEFNITVLENPADITITNCPADITVDAAPGAPTAVVTWTDPTATTDCYKPNTNIEQTIGFASGSDFLVGSQNIAYSITDSCGNFMACSFNVTVQSVLAILTPDTCPSDQNIQVAVGETSAIATWTDPTGTSDCYTGTVQASQLAGLVSGSSFPLGLSQIVYVLTDECGNSSLCTFNINVSEECPEAGTTCDDGDASTENDVEDGNCNCSGTPCLEAGTTCDDGDASTENDMEDGNCNCAGTPCPEAGTTCDDGDATTENDIEDGNCNCAGTPILCPDAGTTCDDGDASTENDVEDGNCNCTGTPCPEAGTTCDDGDATTENDVADGTCGCTGTPIVAGCSTTENLSLKPTTSASQSSTQLGAEASRAIDGNTNGNFFGGNSVSLTTWETNAWLEIDLGLVSNIETINIWNREDCCQQFLSNYYIFISDVPFTSTDINETLNQVGVSNFLQTDQAELPSAISIDVVGRYVRIQLIGTSFLGLTEVEVIGCIAGSGCAPAGTVCDDGDTTTENDVEDGNCGCVGTPCPIAGTTCDDGNTTTENDVADGSCGCAGTPIGGGCSVTENLALGGFATESSFQLGADGSRAIDGNTNGDFFGGNSVTLTNWTTQPWVEVDLGSVGNIETINVWNRTDCCEGFLKNYYIFVSDVPFVSSDVDATVVQAGVDSYFQNTTAGTPTAISINRTGQYVRIQLQGTSFLGLAELEIIGCADPGGCPTAGTSCDDGDASTENDVEDGNCGCAGTPCPIAGTTCDDGDSNTSNDMEDGNCNCEGTPINCPDAGTACDDGDASTENDVEDGNCGCAGTPCPIAGTTCDDGDENTENDIEDGNCNCTGTPISTGGCPTTSNLSLSGTANQSSTLTAGGITGSAGKAIDGNTNGVFFTGDPSLSSVSATNNTSEPFWEVELDASYLIEQIDVYNRTDGVDRSNDIYVLVSNVPFTSPDLTGARAEAIWEEFIPGQVGSPSSVLPNIVGQYVRIQMQGSGYLVLAEVEVIGCTDPNQTSLAVPNMLYFHAKKNGIQTNVDWMMTKDVVVDYYEVEVSTDGNNFRLLDEVNADQVDAPRQYDLIDLKPAFGENFYRLKVNLLDGTYFYSNIRRVNFEIDFDDVIVYPNPTDDLIQIALRDFAGKAGTIGIYNNLGQKMAGRNYLSFPTIPAVFDVSEFTNGMYTISIKIENHRRFTKKFIVNKL